MSLTDRFLENNRASRARRETDAPRAYAPTRAAVVACMDARLDMYTILGLREGEAHVIRNAGGVVTDDVLRSLIVSQRLLGTQEIILVHHTDCGMLSFRDDEMREKIAAEVGQKPLFAFQAFTDLEADVRESLRRVRESPFLMHREARGFIYDVATGRLDEVR